ncbi:hypothetical protein A0H81_13017 [Grifola frondosa]|uniref:Uncharacterized protein n=1 Tax=Grifola frondosa TaxID=5627 RepID=A0A1C7LWA0_GRIFR|nr:hypothetical protein A0H81_13017 [Grifola frondosa]
MISAPQLNLLALPAVLHEGLSCSGEGLSSIPRLLHLVTPYLQTLCIVHTWGIDLPYIQVVLPVLKSLTILGDVSVLLNRGDDPDGSDPMTCICQRAQSFRNAVFAWRLRAFASSLVELLTINFGSYSGRGPCAN